MLKPRSRTQLLRTLGLLVALMLGWRALGAKRTEYFLNQFNTKRAIQRDGDRESFMVKERWIHPGGILRRATWGACDRVMVFKMSG